MKKTVFKRVIALLLCLLLAMTVVHGSVTKTAASEVAKDLVTNKTDQNMEEILKGLIQEGKRQNGLSKDGLDQNEIVRVTVEMKKNTVIDEFGRASYSQTIKDCESLLLTEQQDIIEQVEKISGNKVINRSVYVVNTFTINVKRSLIPAIASIKGVKSVSETSNFSMPASVGTDINEFGTVKQVWEDQNLGYTGEGILVAVADTGVNYRHKDMVLNEGTKTKYTEAEWKEKIETLGYGKYYSSKVPFGYSYTENLNEILNEQNTHGYHVSGIVAANGDVENGGVRGVAPDAQIMGMKVFSNNEDDGAFSDDIVRAIEDAVKLGADIINLSLGTANGFSSDYNIVQAAVMRAMEKGVLVVVAGGNDQTSVAIDSNADETNNYDYTDTGMISSPATAPDTISVSSMGYSFGLYFVVDINDGHKTTSHNFAAYIKEFDGATTSQNKAFENWWSSDEASSLDLVDCGYGTLDEIPDTVAGQIAVIKRGSIDGSDFYFVEKFNNAIAKGATAIILYNNVDGNKVINPSLSLDENTSVESIDAYLPIVSVSQNDGKIILDAMEADDDVTFKGYQEVEGDVISSSRFTSWGPTSDLAFKPEISAPGSNIYSLSSGVDGYENMSGTSMACPYLSGCVALFLQSIKEKEMNLEGKELIDYIKTNMMNTADIIYDLNHYTETAGVPVSVRAQGAGTVNIYNALNNQVTITHNGKPSIELGAFSNKEVIFTIDVKNNSDEGITFATPAPTVYVDFTDDYNDNTEEITDDLEYMPTYKYYITPARGEILGAKMVLTDNKSTHYVESGETLTIEYKLSVSTLKEGHFVEGFIQLYDYFNEDYKLNIPFLGFYGDWEKERIFDTTADKEDSFIKNNFDDSMYGTGLYSIDNQYWSLLGFDGVDYKSERAAFSPNGDGSYDFVIPRFVQLRNAAEMMIHVENEDGKVVTDLGKIYEARKTSYAELYQSSMDKNELNYSTAYSNWNYYLSWEGSYYDIETGQFGDLPDGNYTVVVKAKVSSNSTKYQEYRYPILLDTKEPTVEFDHVDINNQELYIKATDVSGLYQMAALFFNGYQASIPLNSDSVRLEEYNSEKGEYLFAIKLPEKYMNVAGSNYVGVGLVDNAGNVGMVETYYNSKGETGIDTIEVNTLREDEVLITASTGVVNITGYAPENVKVYVNGVKTIVSNKYNFKGQPTLKPGLNDINITAVDEKGDTIFDKTYQIYSDTVLLEAEVSLSEDFTFVGMEDSFPEQEQYTYLYQYFYDYNEVDIDEDNLKLKSIPVTMNIVEEYIAETMVYVKNENYNEIIRLSDGVNEDGKPNYLSVKNGENNLVLPRTGTNRDLFIIAIYDQGGNYYEYQIYINYGSDEDFYQKSFSVTGNFGQVFPIAKEDIDEDGYLTLGGQVTGMLEGYEDTLVFTINEEPIELDQEGEYEYKLKIKPGMNTAYVYIEYRGIVYVNGTMRGFYLPNPIEIDIQDDIPANNIVYTNKDTYTLKAILTSAYNCFDVYINSSPLELNPYQSSPIDGDLATYIIDVDVPLTGEKYNYLEIAAYDLVGQESIKQVIVIVDKEAPLAPEISLTKDNRLNVKYSDKDVVAVEYSIDNGTTWNVLDSKFVANEREEVLVRLLDRAGNYSKVTSITRPDKTAPTQVTVQDNAGVITLIPNDSDVEKIMYSIDNMQTWNEYTEPFAIESFTTVFAYAIDDYDNLGDSICYEGLDYTAPNKPVISSSKNTVTIKPGSDEEVTIEYSFDGETWKTYDGKFKINKKTTVYARSVNSIGVKSEVVKKTVKARGCSCGSLLIALSSMFVATATSFVLIKKKH